MLTSGIRSYLERLLSEKQVIVILLATTALYVSRFWHFPEFGLYEDDITIIPRTLTMSNASRLRFVGHYIMNLYGHGRPIEHSFIYLLTPAAWKLAGLRGAYFVGILMVSINTVLFTLLLRRLHSIELATFGGLAYALFSADTTQILLSHSIGLHPSLTFLLIGFHLYMSGREHLAFLPVALVLFSYETPYPVFMAAPLLKKGDWDRKRLFRVIRHALVMLTLLMGVFALRTIVGEGRVSGLSFQQVLTVPLVHMFQGPIVSLGSYALRPYQALLGLDLEIALAAAITTAIFLTIFSRMMIGLQASVTQWLEVFRSPAEVFTSETPMTRLARLAIAGLVMLIMAYPLTFTVRAYAISGRQTRVHFAAVLGSALLVGIGSVLLRSLSSKPLWKRVTSLSLALLFGCLIGFGFLVQEDYARAWDYQRAFWQQLYPMIQDAGEGTAILIEPTGLRDTRYIDANTWNLPEYLDEIHLFPETWAEPPRVYRLVPGWQAHILTEDRQLRLSGNTVTSSSSFHRLVPPENAIAFSTSTGSLQRLSELETEAGRVSLRRAWAGKNRLADYPVGPSYELLFDEPYRGPSPFLIP